MRVRSAISSSCRVSRGQSELATCVRVNHTMLFSPIIALRTFSTFGALNLTSYHLFESNITGKVGREEVCVEG